MALISNHSTVLVSKKYSSFEELAEIAHGWKADFRQLGPELFDSRLFQAKFGNMLLSESQIGCASYKKGLTPKAMRTFAIRNQNCTELHWYGHILNQDALLCFPAHREMDAYSGPGFSVLTFSIPEDLLENYFERNQCPNRQHLARRENFFTLSTTHANELRLLLKQAFDITKTKHIILHKEILIDEIQEKILYFLLKILTKTDATSDTNKSYQHRALKKIFDYTHCNSGEPIRLAELCEITQLSERSIQQIFKHQLGIAPKKFLSAFRLSGAHRDLWRSDDKQTKVADIANYWGYWHLGQFAADYRNIFGELPSITLQR